MILEIVTPEQALLKEEVDAVTIPGALGEFGILPGHTTLLSELGNGKLSYQKGPENKFLEISGGFAEVRENHVTVLADRVTQQ